MALTLAGCAHHPAPAPETAQQPVTPALPPAFPAKDLIGNWGLAAYHTPTDRDRTIAAAANQCGNPYVIMAGPGDGVLMHLADQAQRSDLVLKGAPGGKTYLGPKDEPPGGTDDREVVSFDGRVLILHWMDPEVQGRYGTMVYVRCAPESHTHHVRHKAKPRKPSLKPKPNRS
jgi:hypothetical protein